MFLTLTLPHTHTHSHTLTLSHAHQLWVLIGAPQQRLRVIQGLGFGVWRWSPPLPRLLLRTFYFCLG